MAFVKGLFGCALIFIAVLHGATADTYTVLDGMGWIVPPAGSVAYRTWAAGKEFEVGDTLVFNFPTNQHDVTEVTKAAFEACTKTSPISAVKTSPANILLNSAGEHFYICTIGQHCSLGQKLAINVSTSSDTPPGSPTPPSSTPPSSPTPPSSSTPPPSPTPPSSSASSIVVGGFSVALLSIAMAVLY